MKLRRIEFETRAGNFSITHDSNAKQLIFVGSKKSTFPASLHSDTHERVARVIFSAVHPGVKADGHVDFPELIRWISRLSL
jgi:hypothetical protein